MTSTDFEYRVGINVSSSFLSGHIYFPTDFPWIPQIQVGKFSVTCKVFIL